jgi:hypothetical protein
MMINHWILEGFPWFHHPDAIQMPSSQGAEAGSGWRHVPMEGQDQTILLSLDQADQVAAGKTTPGKTIDTC